MAKDIYAGYINELNQPEVRPHTGISSADIPAGQNTLQVLKEISSKLDAFQPSGANSGTPEAELAVINGKVVIPDQGILEADIYVRDGKIHALGRQAGIRAKRTIDAAGKYVCPGIVDPHTHLGLFTPLDIDMESETRAAIAGGVTTMGVFIGGERSHFDTMSEFAAAMGKNAYTDVIPHLVIGTGEQKREIREYSRRLGITSFKLYLNGIPGMIKSVDDAFIADVLEQVKSLEKPGIVCCHAENPHLVARALRQTKEKYPDSHDISYWAETHPSMAEEEAVIRMSYLAGKMETPVYLVHISSRVGIERLRQLKPYNKYLHVETTSPYLAVNGGDLTGPLFKMEPPIRDREDQEALWQALDDGIIDTIGTDNTCGTIAEKNPDDTIWNVIPGYSVIQGHLSAAITEGVVKRGLTLEKVITHMTKRPAEIFGIYPQKGTLLPGSDADMVILDLAQSDLYKAAEQLSRSDFSIYEGRQFYGRPFMTIKGGQVAAEDGRMSAQPPRGILLER